MEIRELEAADRDAGDRAGALRDLMILAHSVDEQWSSTVVAGIADEL